MRLLLLLIALPLFAVDAFNLVERFGVTHPQQVVTFAFTGGIRKQTGYAMTGPGGSEVGWGQRTDGAIEVQSRLPRSLGYPAPLQWTNVGTCDTANEWMRLDAAYYNGNFSVATNFALMVGDPVLITAVQGTACGMTSGTIYYIAQILADTPTRGQTAYKFSASQSLSPVVDLTSGGGTVTVQRAGFVQDTSDGTGDTLYAGTHDYAACDTVKPIAYTGALPTGMSSTVYYIKSPSATGFKLSTSCNGSTLDLTPSSGSGVWLMETNFTWTLSTGVTAATIANPVTINNSNASYIEVSNGLAGTRIPTVASNPNPAQTWRMDQGAFATNAATCDGISNLTIDFASAHGLTTSNSVSVSGGGASAATVTDSNWTNINVTRTVASVPTSTKIVLAGTCNANGRIWNSTNSPTLAVIKGSPPNLAPSQGYLVAGTWSTATNRVKVENPNNMGELADSGQGTTDAYSVLSYAVRYEESSSLRTTVVSSYVVNRPVYHNGSTTYGNNPGIGFITVRQTILSGHRSILVEVDSDIQHWTTHNFYSAFASPADRVRWRGHIAGSTACGYMETGGGVYLLADSRPAQDALVNISYASPRRPTSGACLSDGSTWLPLIPWNGQSGVGDKGWYLQLYNSSAASGDPVVGVFTGQASRMIDVNSGGPVLNTTTNTLEIVSWLNLGTGSSALGRQRLNYGLYFDTKANLPASTVSQQPIWTERNVLAGINLSKQNQYILSYSDPAGGWKPLYQGVTGFNNLRAAIADGTSKCGTPACYYNKIYPNLQATGAVILDMWRNGTTAAWLNIALSNLTVHANKWMYILTNLDGNNDWYLTHAQAGFEVNKRAGMANALLLETLTSTQKDQVKAIASQFGNILWDNDFAAYDNSAGDTFGTPNFPIQYKQYRAQSALFLISQPLLTTKQATARGYVLNDLTSIMNQYGSGFDSMWYMGSGGEPVMLNLLTMLNAGQLNCADYTQIPLHAQWQASALTPPEPRFSSTSMRKWVSNGDGNTHSNVLPMLMATLMNQCGNSNVAQLAEWVWQSMNRSDLYTIDDFSGFTPGALDDTITATDPNLSSQHFTGYWSVLRHGWGTNNETAAYFINGDFYRDHRSFDYGTVMLYVHKAPLSIKFNPNLYYPQVNGQYYMPMSITRASDIGQAWDADSPPLTAGGPNVTPTQNDYAGFTKSSFSSTTFAQSPNWTRIVQMGYGSAAYPVIRLKDTFASAVSRVLTLPMMATGNLTVMGSPITPTQRDNNNDTTKASNGITNAMTTAALNRIQATGAVWTGHATGGIDWDVYVVPSSTSQIMVGNWSHNQHNGREVSEYATACASGCSFGSSFRERQHIVRVEGSGSFDTIILPWRKGEAPTQTVSLATCPGGAAGIQIARTAPSTVTECINDGEYTWSSGSNKLLSVMDSASHTAFSMNISGGPGELYYNGTTVVAVINGTVAAERQIDLSALAGGPWFPSIAVMEPVNSSIYKTYHAGGAQPSSLTVTFTTSAGASSLFVYSFGGKAGTTDVVLTFSDGSKIRAPWSGAVKVRVPTGVTLSSTEYL